MGFLNLAIGGNQISANETCAEEEQNQSECQAMGVNFAVGAGLLLGSEEDRLQPELGLQFGRHYNQQNDITSFQTISESEIQAAGLNTNSPFYDHYIGSQTGFGNGATEFNRGYANLQLGALYNLDSGNRLGIKVFGEYQNFTPTANVPLEYSIDTDGTSSLLSHFTAGAILTFEHPLTENSSLAISYKDNLIASAVQAYNHGAPKTGDEIAANLPQFGMNDRSLQIEYRWYPQRQTPQPQPQPIAQEPTPTQSEPIFIADEDETNPDPTPTEHPPFNWEDEPIDIPELKEPPEIDRTPIAIDDDEEEPQDIPTGPPLNLDDDEIDIPEIPVDPPLTPYEEDPTPPEVPQDPIVIANDDDPNEDPIDPTIIKDPVVIAEDLIEEEETPPTPPPAKDEDSTPITWLDDEPNEDPVDTPVIKDPVVIAEDLIEEEETPPTPPPAEEEDPTPITWLDDDPLDTGPTPPPVVVQDAPPTIIPDLPTRIQWILDQDDPTKEESDELLQFTFKEIIEQLQANIELPNYKFSIKISEMDHDLLDEEQKIAEIDMVKLTQAIQAFRAADFDSDISLSDYLNDKINNDPTYFSSDNMYNYIIFVDIEDQESGSTLTTFLQNKDTNNYLDIFEFIQMIESQSQESLNQILR